MTEAEFAEAGVDDDLLHGECPFIFIITIHAKDPTQENPLTA